MLTDPDSTARSAPRAPAILLIGKTGSGKSTLANMLFKEEKFLTSESLDSGTQICQSALLRLGDIEYNLVDTPGIFDTMKPDDETLKEIAQSIVQCSYGIKAILFVVEWGRYTIEQQATTDKVLEFLGRESCRNMIVVFTKCRRAQTEDRAKLEPLFNDKLISLLNKVGNRWVVSPDLEIFDKPNDPSVELHMNDLKNYIRLNPKPYTTDLFKRVRAACEEGTENDGIKLAEEEFIKSGGGCFSLHSKVILADGRKIEMSQLSIGDMVCCGEKNGKLIFSEIYAIVHADNQTVTQYQRINYLKADGTEGSKETFQFGTLCLTPKHHLFVSQGKTIFAEDVCANVTELLFFDGKKLVPVVPHQVTMEWELGYIAPFTQSGKIIVDEILCSCYAVAPPYQEIINFAMIPFRLYSWVMPTANCKKEIHPYLHYLKRGQWFLKQIDYFKRIS